MLILKKQIITKTTVDVSLEIRGENFESAYFPFGLSEQKGIHVE